MSLPLYQVGGLRFWNEREILARERMSHQIVEDIQRTLRGLNQAWAFERVDCPLIMPRSRINPNYTNDDVFVLEAQIGNMDMVLRPETTEGSYTMVEHMLRSHEINVRPPLCVWQLGQSFRRELNDGASAAKLRFNSFYQLEFQCVYASSSGADYATAVRDSLVVLLGDILNRPTRLEPTDRRPSYSSETIDIEVSLGIGEKGTEIWREIASTSRRADLPEFPGYEKGGKKELTVFEVAFGADRLVEILHATK